VRKSEFLAFTVLKSWKVCLCLLFVLI